MLAAATSLLTTLPEVLIAGLIVVALSLLLKRWKQPYLVGYLVAGVLLGPAGFGVVTNVHLIEGLGELGLILLLFFIGMEISLPEFVSKWRVAVIGTGLQILASIALVAAVGWAFDWPWPRILLFGMLISLSSSAVVIKLLQDRGELASRTGQNVLSILLSQDMAIVPMLIAAGFLAGTAPSASQIVLQVAGGVLFVGMLAWLLRNADFRLPFSETIERDHELQVLASLVICFGFALVSALFGLSAALGAFIAGLVVNQARATRWIHDSLHAFRVVFVALFFMSVGMLIDLNFLVDNIGTVLLLLGVTYLTNHLINAAILRSFRSTWRESLYGGALLAQIGELSFILAATGYASGIISDYGYRMAILVIALTILLSPLYIAVTRRLLGRHGSPRLR